MNRIKKRRLALSAKVLARKGIVPFTLWWGDLADEDKDLLRDEYGVHVFQSAREERDSALGEIGFYSEWEYPVGQRIPFQVGPYQHEFSLLIRECKPAPKNPLYPKNHYWIFGDVLNNSGDDNGGDD